MSNDVVTTLDAKTPGDQLRRDFQHLRSSWCWFFSLGILLTACGLAALIFPALTIITSFVAVIILGVSLMVAGIGTILASFWAGRWSGLLLQWLIGILYLVVGFTITETPARSAAALTAMLAAFFIVGGLFRIVAALIVRFPRWGWALLNGVITLLMGVVIYRHFPDGKLWVIGILVGVEMLFHGWNWLMLGLAIRSLPEPAK